MSNYTIDKDDKNESGVDIDKDGYRIGKKVGEENAKEEESDNEKKDA